VLSLSPPLPPPSLAAAALAARGEESRQSSTTSIAAAPRIRRGARDDPIRGGLPLSVQGVKSERKFRVLIGPTGQRRFTLCITHASPMTPRESPLCPRA